MTIMKYRLSLFSLLLIFILTSCKTDFSVWKRANENWLEQTNKQYIDSLAKAPQKSGYQDAGITDSGIQYIIRHSGYGATAKSSSIVNMSYQNYLIDGKAVGKVTDGYFKVFEQIEGWQEMLCKRGLKVGANVTLYIPWNLAYGDKGLKVAGADRFFIPPYSTIISNITVLNIFNAPPK